MVAVLEVKPKQLFLLDGLGALLSAFLLGVVLASFEAFFGMPKRILYLLALLPCLFALYSLWCFSRTPQNWRPYLRGIAVANLLYCCLTLGMVIYFYPQLSAWGIAYFVAEMIVVAGLASVELKIASR